MDKIGDYYGECPFSTQDFWWLIGLFEGEASFMSANKQRPRSPRISIGMTDEDTIAKVSCILGVKYHSRMPSSGRKRIYTLDMKGTRAAELMILFYPHMSSRRKGKIKAALKTYGPRKYYYGEEHHNTKLKATDIKTIRMRRKGGELLREIAVDYGVTTGCISNIVRRISWATYD